MKYVKTNMGIMSLEDYLDIKALSYGYDDYKEMKEHGLSIKVEEDSIFEK